MCGRWTRVLFGVCTSDRRTMPMHERCRFSSHSYEGMVTRATRHGVCPDIERVRQFALPDACKSIRLR